MADVGEILKFREHKERSGGDDCHYGAIVRQLQDVVGGGHDVQLHIHSSYYNAVRVDGRWQQDWGEYDFARLPYERMGVESQWRFFRKMRSPAYAALYRIAIAAASLLRIAVLLLAWPWRSGRPWASPGALRKWTARLRWTLGGERWVRDY